MCVCVCVGGGGGRGLQGLWRFVVMARGGWAHDNEVWMGKDSTQKVTIQLKWHKI